jgi:hypothetical protein
MKTVYYFYYYLFSHNMSFVLCTSEANGIRNRYLTIFLSVLILVLI